MPRLSRSLLMATLGAAVILPIVASGFTLDATPAGESARLGPPWISIEYPPNPHDAGTRGAFLVVNSFHHETPVTFPVSGLAEGMVNGERRTVKLELQRTSRPGAYALRKQWSDEGTWVLVLRVHQGDNAAATALVSLARDGSIASVEVPTRRQGQWTIPRVVTTAEIESLLARRVAARE